jgi:hypothetical protein
MINNLENLRIKHFCEGTCISANLSVSMNKYLKQLSLWKSLLFLKTYPDDYVFLLFEIYVVRAQIRIGNISFKYCS